MASTADQLQHPPDQHPPPPPPPALAPSRRKGYQGQHWTDLETTHLIKAYEEKWYSQKRGQLKAHQWEDVAATVAARCGLDPPSKSGTQCRHKMEKLRKRYRAERQRPVPSRWIHFDLLDQLERGPLPISARPPAPPHPPPPQQVPQPPPVPNPPAARAEEGSSEEEEDDSEESEEAEEVIVGNHHLGINSNGKRVTVMDEFGQWGFGCGSNSKRFRFKREEEEEEEHVESSRGQIVGELAAAMMRLEEGLMRIEKRRVELMRNFERDLMELEGKRSEVVLQSHRCLIEVIGKALTRGGKKKGKKGQQMMG